MGREMFIGHAHIYALGRNFCEVGKDGEGRCQTIEDDFFLILLKRLKMKEPDDKLLKML